MIIRRFLNYWFGRTRHGFYLFLAVLAAVLYFTGSFLPAGDMGYVPAFLKLSGFLGFLMVALIFLIHLNLHANHWFLEHFRDMDHLPIKQISHVNSFCMTLFLSAAVIIIPAAACGTDPLWTAIWRWFVNRSHSEQPVLSSPVPQSAPMNAPDLSQLLGEPNPTLPWLIVLDEILRAAGTILAVIFLILAVRGGLRRIWKWVTKPRLLDSDEKIYLTPTWMLPSAEKKAKNKRTSFLFRSYDEKIRHRYRREILTYSRKKKYTPSPALSPQELEQAAGLNQPLLHQLYEKARYSGKECGKEEWESLL